MDEYDWARRTLDGHALDELGDMELEGVLTPEEARSLHAATRIAQRAWFARQARLDPVRVAGIGAALELWPTYEAWQEEDARYHRSGEARLDAYLRARGL